MKAVIFDMDGLLIDSEPIWHSAFEALCKENKIIPDENVFKSAMGMGLKEVVVLYGKKLGFKQDAKELINEFRKIFYRISLDEGGLRLMEGTREFLAMVKNSNMAVGLATGGHDQAMTIKILNKVNLYDFFDEIVSSDNVKKGKPSPEVYFFTAEKLGAKPSECLVLEDAVNGVMAGKAAGMRVFGVNKDESIRKNLKNAGADEVFSSLLEIKNI